MFFPLVVESKSKQRSIYYLRKELVHENQLVTQVVLILVMTTQR